MLHEFIPHIAGTVVACVMGLFAYLTRSYFARIHDDIKEVQAAVDRLSGRLDAVSSDVRANTSETAVARVEFKALWRVIDNAYERASDVNGAE